MHFIPYLMAAMTAWCPPSDHRFYLRHTDMTDEQRDTYTIARYKSIAQDVEGVVEEVKPLFGGPKGKLRTALLVLSIASYESGEFREDVDNTDGTGDHGNAHCIMQIEYPLRDGETMKDRKDCIRIGIERARESMKACPNSRLEDKLSVYARGKCDDEWGSRNSRMKMKRAMKFLTEHPFLTLDGEIE